MSALAPENANPMEMFAHDDEVTRLEAAMPFAEQDARLEMQVALAWHLRQRATDHALRLADDAETLLANCSLPLPTRQGFSARLLLVRAEVYWLFSELNLAEQLTEQALRLFTELNDAIGCADAHWMNSWIAVHRGDSERDDSEIALAAAQARSGGDAIRVDIAEATQAFNAALHDADSALVRWGSRFHDNMPSLPPSVAGPVCNFLAIIASLSSDFGCTAAYLIEGYEKALRVGQVRSAIIAAANVGDAFSSLNDHHSALEWMQRALDLARPTGWSASIGTCLTQTAEVLRHLGRLEAAQELLDEALVTLAPVAGSRSHTIALEYMGDLALDRGDYNRALECFDQLLIQAESLQQSDFQTTALRGKAHAFLQLGRPHEALAAAQTSLTKAQASHHAYNQIASLKVLSDIHKDQSLPAPSGMVAANATLHYLQQAQAVAAGIDGYMIPGDLLDAIANAHAAIDDYRTAFSYAHQANAVREKTHNQDATNRAIAMQVRHQTERAKSESKHHRELAQAEAERAHVLQQTSATLAHLGAVGQEITAHLNAQAVFTALNTHVSGMLDVNSFAIYLLEHDGSALHLAFGIEAGQELPTARIELDDPYAGSARCLRLRDELVLSFLPVEDEPNLIPGTLSSLSRLFAPLAIGSRIMGVMTVQSRRQNAYGERERLIFRTLCAYGAIALDNANAYRQLELAQEQLVGQEKLAALGALVAGVAHELNTPIGNSLIMASSLQEKTDEIDTKMAERSLQHNELQDYLCDAREASVLIMRGLSSAVDLVNSFKQVAVDRTSAQRRKFDLQQTSHEIIATMMNQIKLSGNTIELDIPTEIAMHSYPGPFGQVLANLINNALLHAFDDNPFGHMLLSARLSGRDRVRIVFKDNGCGIAEQQLNRIFDPFYTTKMGQGGSGLGLSISYNIVTSLLNGQIIVQSKLGAGTSFILDLPLIVAEQANDISD
jgi:signal transduction histidine kinase